MVSRNYINFSSASDRYSEGTYDLVPHIYTRESYADSAGAAIDLTNIRLFADSLILFCTVWARLSEALRLTLADVNLDQTF